MYRPFSEVSRINLSFCLFLLMLALLLGSEAGLHTLAIEVSKKSEKKELKGPKKAA